MAKKKKAVAVKKKTKAGNNKAGKKSNLVNLEIHNSMNGAIESFSSVNAKFDDGFIKIWGDSMPNTRMINKDVIGQIMITDATV